MERHHSAERHLYPEVIDVLKQIKEEHPNVIIGAVTDGKANPMLMTFTLAPYFDFCLSWEDDQAGRTQFFKELKSTGSDAELKWIYEAARDKYKELAETRELSRRIAVPVLPPALRISFGSTSAMIWHTMLEDPRLAVPKQFSWSLPISMVRLPAFVLTI